MNPEKSPKKQKINYQLKLDRILSSLGEDVPTLLLHSCCAPCSSYVLEYLSQYFYITVYYYNPNIYPREEYLLRSSEERRLIDSMPTKYPVCCIDDDYNANEFFSRVKGLENEPEGGRRCAECFRLRLERTALKAAELSADYFTSTLTISPLKNAQLINQIGLEMSKKYNIAWLPSDFKKKEGYKRSIVLSKQYGLYRQDYCGCVFSREQRNRESACKNS